MQGALETTRAMDRGFQGNRRRTSTVAGESTIAELELPTELSLDEVVCQRSAVIDLVDDVEVSLVQICIVVASERGDLSDGKELTHVDRR